MFISTCLWLLFSCFFRRITWPSPKQTTRKIHVQISWLYTKCGLFTHLANEHCENNCNYLVARCNFCTHSTVLIYCKSVSVPQHQKRRNQIQISDTLDRSTFKKTKKNSLSPRRLLNLCKTKVYIYIFFKWNSPWKRNAIIWSAKEQRKLRRIRFIYTVCKFTKVRSVSKNLLRTCWKCENVSDNVTYNKYVRASSSHDSQTVFVHISCSFKILYKIIFTLSPIVPTVAIFRCFGFQFVFSITRATRFIQSLKTFIDHSIS